MGLGTTQIRSERHDDQLGQRRVELATRERPLTRKASRDDLLWMVAQGGPLIEGTNLRCPGCERTADVLDYVPLEYSERYATQVVVPLKCRSCRHIFALRP